MRDNGQKCIVQAYNAQLAVDGQKQIIVAADVTQEVVDCGQLLPMLDKTISMVNTRPAISRMLDWGRRSPGTGRYSRPAFAAA